MIDIKKSNLIALFTVSLISTYASTPPKIADKKTYPMAGRALVIGGAYSLDKNQLTIAASDESVMKKLFFPHTPTKIF